MKPAPVCPTPSLDAKQIIAPLVINGELDEAPWRETQSTGAFLLENEGKSTSPHSELRALWSKDALILGLYAADQDLRAADDAFIVHLDAKGSPLTLRVPAKGDVTCLGCELPKGIKAAVDVDGTFDDPSDEDEEWAVELFIPWAALNQSSPPAELSINVERTDTPKATTPRTTAWACAGPKAMGTLHLRSP